MSNNAPDFDLEFKDVISSEPAKDTSLEPQTREVPDKFKGKDIFDVIDMYSNAEKKISEQGTQLHELRTLSDELIGLKKDNAKEKVKVTTEDLLTDPDVALTKAIDSSDLADRAAKTADRLDAIEKSLGQREFEGKHPEFMKDAQDPDFQKWVLANKARIGLMTELNNNYNFDAGVALWDMWEETKDLASRKKETITAAKTVRGSPAEGSRKPVYSRAKLLELQTKAVRGDRTARAQWEDPVFQKEYQEAYRDGRVK